MKQSLKADARLERRLRAFEQTMKTAGSRSTMFNKPGSKHKAAPKGRS